MLTWEERIERIKEACSIKSNRQLEERLGLANGYINDLLKGKNKNPGKLAAALMKDLGVNPMWFEDETLDIFGKIDFEKLIPPKSLFLKELDKYIKEVVSDDFMRILVRLKTVEDKLGILPSKSEPKASYEESLAALQHREKDSFTVDPVPVYNVEYKEEKYEKTPYVHNIAAGPPTLIDGDSSETVRVLSRLLRDGERYYVAKIKGGSMTGAGILDGDMVLIRYADVPRDGAIQVVRYRDKVTLKRLREIEGKGWELHYMDGSEKVINCDSDDYETLGEFVTVLPKNANQKDL